MANDAHKSPSQLAAYSDLFDRLQDCALLVDVANYVILDVNAACIEAFATFSKEKIVGRPLSQWIDSAYWEDFSRALQVSARGDRQRRFDTLWKLGEKRATMEVSASLVVLSNQRSILQIVARDVTFRRESEQLIQVLKQKLASAVVEGTLPVPADSGLTVNLSNLVDFQAVKSNRKGS